MDGLLAPIYVFLGFFVGTLFGMQMVRWGTLLWVATTKHGGDFLGAPKRRLLWALPFVAVLHPAPYLVVALVGFTVWALQGKVGSVWLWLLAGFYVYLAIMSMTLIRSYRLLRKRRALAGPNNRWRGP